MKLNKVAAFSLGNQGGNPAGVAICEDMPKSAEMLKIAKEVGYSETAFLHKHQDGWRVRYFAPEMEVPFCGHATIATGFVLGKEFGEGLYRLYLNDSQISVSVEKTKSILKEFGLDKHDLNSDFPLRFANAGAKHLIIVLKDHAKLKEMTYDFDRVRSLMEQEGLVTYNLLWNASDNTFHSRNAFAAGWCV
ncbi:putative isomerase YddE [Nymphon striatum]|nr:putative isomerase YddE [Nymphon striatum]